LSRLAEHRPSVQTEPSAGFLLYDRSPCSNFTITNDIADPDLHQIASAKLAIDGQVKDGMVPDSPMLVEKETDRPYLTGL
jgi:hypothetical protein